MTRIKIIKSRIRKLEILSKSLSVLGMGLLVLWTSPVMATEFEIARLASQIYSYSANLAHQVRYTRGYGNVKIQADRLSREAAQLVDAIQRGSNVSTVRSQFKAISRRYESLETAFLRANRSSHDPRLYNSVGIISDLYSALSNQVYYTDSVYRSPDLYYYNPPFISRQNVPAYSGQQNSGPFSGRNQNQRRSRLDYDTINAGGGIRNQ